MGESQKTKITFARCFVYGTFFLLFSPAQSAPANSSLIGNLTAPYLAFLDNIYYNLQGAGGNISDACKADTRQLINLAREDDINALKILDATGKASSGILQGGVYFIGYYSECINTIVQSQENSFKAKYCLVSFKASATSRQKVISHASWKVLTENSKPPTIGVCVPHSCTTADVQHATTNSVQDNFEDIDGSVSVCHGDSTGFSRDVGAIITSCIWSFFLLLIIVGTVRDYIIDYKRKLAHKTSSQGTDIDKNVSTLELCKKEESKDESLVDQFLLAFSLKTNATKIFTIHKGEKIAILDGVKFLSMVLVIFGHTYSFATQNLFIANPGTMQQAPKGFLTQIFANGTFIVDNFFMISGCLTTYTFLQKIDKKKHFPFAYFYLHRYFRLTPALFAVVIFCAYLLKYTSTGPNWPNSIEMYDQWCSSNGWLNILYLQNFFNTENMCLSHSWYLSADMQMYIIAPVILIPLIKNFKVGVIIMVLFLAASTLITALITAINHYPAIPYINNIVQLDVVNAYYKHVYIKPYCRMGPYIVGMGTACFLHRHKELNIKKRTAAFLWCLSIGAGLAVIYLMWPANKGILPTVAEAAAYSALARTVWSLCIGWLILACRYGYGGFVNHILSWSFFEPLNRLTYCAYLIHPVVMNVYYGSTESAVMFSASYLIYSFMGTLIISYVLSLLLTMLFESPCINLEKMMIKKRS